MTIFAVLGGLAAIVAVLTGVTRFVTACYRASTKLTRALDLLEHLDRYTRHHLGPNGDSMPLHERIARLESDPIRA